MSYNVLISKLDLDDKPKSNVELQNLGIIKFGVFIPIKDIKQWYKDNWVAEYEYEHKQIEYGIKIPNCFSVS